MDPIDEFRHADNLITVTKHKYPRTLPDIYENVIVEVQKLEVGSSCRTICVRS